MERVKPSNPQKTRNAHVNQEFAGLSRFQDVENCMFALEALCQMYGSKVVSAPLTPKKRVREVKYFFNPHNT